MACKETHDHTVREGNTAECHYPGGSVIYFRVVSRGTMGGKQKQQLQVSIDNREWIKAKNCYSNAWDILSSALEAVGDVSCADRALEIVAK